MQGCCLNRSVCNRARALATVKTSEVEVLLRSGSGSQHAIRYLRPTSAAEALIRSYEPPSSPSGLLRLLCTRSLT